MPTKKTITTVKTSKKKPSSKLTQEFMDIMQRVKRAENFMAPWHNNIRRWRRLYEESHYSKTAPNDINYNDPTHTNTVDLAVGIMLGNQLQFHSYGFAPTVEERKNTGAMEKLLSGIISYNDERRGEHHMYELVLNFVRDGGGCVYSPYDDSMGAEIENVDSPEGEEKKKAVYVFRDMPILMDIVDPLTVIGLQGGPRKWLLLGRKETRTVLDVEMEFDIELPNFKHLREDEKAQTRGDFYDVWDYVWKPEGELVEGDEDIEEKKSLHVRNTIIFDGYPILGPRLMAGYYDLPYTIQFYNPAGKVPSKWRSIISPLESSVMFMERTFNRRAKQIDTFTALPLIIKTHHGRSVEIEGDLYNTIEIAPDESIEFAQWQGNPPEVQGQLDYLRTRVQQSGFSDVMFGSGSNQVAGYALSQLGDQNRIRLEQPIKHMELLLTTWAKKSVELLKYFASGTAVYVYGRTKGEDYIDRVFIDSLEGYAVRAEIRAVFPNEEMRKVAMSTQVTGVVSDYTKMEKYLGIEQPEDEEERKVIEAAFRDPRVLKYALLKKFKAMADAGDDVAKMIYDSETQKPQAMNPEGRPKDPNKPEQLTGLQSPDGLPVPQAEGGEVPGRSEADAMNNMATAAPNMMGGM